MEDKTTLDVSKEAKAISTQLEKLKQKYSEAHNKELFDAMTMLDSALTSLKKV